MYVVAGVTGKTGAAVAENLLQAGKPVRVIVRDAAKGQPWLARGAQVAVASLDDELALARALDGADGAYLLSPFNLGSDDPISEGWQLADTMARAVDRSGLPHLVFLSSLGASHAEGTGIVRTLHAAEVRLKQVRAKVTFVRAGLFLDEWLPMLDAAVAGGQLPTFLRPDRVIPMVCSRDIGAVAARALLDGPPAGPRAVIALRGPADYSAADLAASLAQLLGRPVAPEFLPDEAVAPTLVAMGATPAVAEQVRLLYLSLNETRLAETDGDNPRPLRGTVTPAQLFGAALAQPGRAASPAPVG